MAAPPTSGATAPLQIQPSGATAPLKIQEAFVITGGSLGKRPWIVSTRDWLKLEPWCHGLMRFVFGAVSGMNKDALKRSAFLEELKGLRAIAHLGNAVSKTKYQIRKAKHRLKLTTDLGANEPISVTAPAVEWQGETVGPCTMALKRPKRSTDAIEVAISVETLNYIKCAILAKGSTQQVTSSKSRKTRKKLRAQNEEGATEITPGQEDA